MDPEDFAYNEPESTESEKIEAMGFVARVPVQKGKLLPTGHGKLWVERDIRQEAPMNGRKPILASLIVGLSAAPVAAAMIGIRGGSGSTSLTAAIDESVPQELSSSTCDLDFADQSCHAYFNDRSAFRRIDFLLFDSTGAAVTDPTVVSLDDDPLNQNFAQRLSFDPLTDTFTFDLFNLPGNAFPGGPPCSSATDCPEFTIYVVDPFLPGPLFLAALDITSIPEPNSLFLLAGALTAVLALRRAKA
jgi:hypothetical protein